MVERMMALEADGPGRVRAQSATTVAMTATPVAKRSKLDVLCPGRLLEKAPEAPLRTRDARPPHRGSAGACPFEDSAAEPLSPARVRGGKLIPARVVFDHGGQDVGDAFSVECLTPGQGFV